MKDAAPRWRKSTWSANEGNCVEVAGNLSGVVLVRDSKDPSGPILTFAPAAWRSLVASLHRVPLD
ncbi:DUF397 domain-containing protein [Micromonospora sp. NPDC050980]|uniref:DUF397 domain-containing protein n=1 Tax=Micromonospora sp. NPDC050980 TaxID=3155161 RepID=UPI003408DA40